MPLLNTQELVEKTITSAIRTVSVQEGYTADVSVYTTNPAYQNAMEAIAAIKNFAVEIYGPGTADRKGVKRVPRIVVTPQKMLSGDVGNIINPTHYNDPDSPGNLISTVLDATTSNLTLEISLSSNSAEQDRILHAILSKAIGQRRYLPFINDNSLYFLIRQYGFFDVPEYPEGIIEKTYNYEVPDLILAETPATLTPALIKEITIETFDNNNINNPISYGTQTIT